MSRPIASAARYDGRENRRVALEAALQVFSDRGFEGASTRAIAATAGLEQGHLAYYFPSKMALWQQVIEAFAREGSLRLGQALSSAVLADSVTTARTALPPFLRSFAENPRMTRLMLQEFSVNSPRHNWVVQNFGQPIWLLLEPLFSSLHAQGLLGGAPPAIAYFSLIGAALITFGNPDLVAAFSGQDTKNADLVEIAISHMLRPLFERS